MILYQRSTYCRGVRLEKVSTRHCTLPRYCTRSSAPSSFPYFAKVLEGPPPFPPISLTLCVSDSLPLLLANQCCQEGMVSVGVTLCEDRRRVVAVRQWTFPTGLKISVLHSKVLRILPYASRCYFCDSGSPFCASRSSGHDSRMNSALQGR